MEVSGQTTSVKCIPHTLRNGNYMKSEKRADINSQGVFSLQQNAFSYLLIFFSFLCIFFCCDVAGHRFHFHFCIVAVKCSSTIFELSIVFLQLSFLCCVMCVYSVCPGKELVIINTNGSAKF